MSEIPEIFLQFHSVINYFKLKIVLTRQVTN